jgi:hypothetical protein
MCFGYFRKIGLFFKSSGHPYDKLLIWENVRNDSFKRSKKYFAEANELGVFEYHLLKRLPVIFMNTLCFW